MRSSHDCGRPRHSSGVKRRRVSFSRMFFANSCPSSVSRSEISLKRCALLRAAARRRCPRMLRGDACAARARRCELRPHALDALVEGFVLEDLGEEDRFLHERHVAGVAHRFVGMDAVEQRDRTEASSRTVPVSSHASSTFSTSDSSSGSDSIRERSSRALGQRFFRCARDLGGIEEGNGGALGGLGPRNSLSGHIRTAILLFSVLLTTADQHRIRIHGRALPPFLRRRKDLDGEVQMRRVGRGVAGRADEADDAPLPDELAFGKVGA